MPRLIFAAVLFTAFTCAATAGDLDKPLNAKPTVRTEVTRGFKAAFYCAIDNSADADNITHCILDHATSEEQSQPDYIPYEVGLYYGACVHLSLLMKSYNDIAATNSVAAADLPVADKALRDMYALFHVKQATQHLSDQQVIDGTGMMSKAKADSLRQLREWAADMPQPPVEH